jgi:cytochrome d ubiquinol oxidase subunit I
MDSALIVDRLHFAFTVTFHYLFPQLTMGLALLLVILKTMALRTANPHYDQCARFWARIFAINFAMGVVTGIPMEFQFGTNWANFSRTAGGVIGQTLAMEGMFSFFLESTFLGIFLFGESRLGPRLHWWSGVAVWAGSWLSGFFIIATDAWMQHPVGYTLEPGGAIVLNSFRDLIFNPWILWQYLHNMIGAVVTASFVMAALGAFYLLTREAPPFGRTFVRVGVIAGFICTILMAFPTGDQQSFMVARYQPVTLAAMEGLFQTSNAAALAIVGQPDTETGKIDNSIELPRALSFLSTRRWAGKVSGLNSFSRDLWPDNIPLLYFSYHIMVGLGTILLLIALAAVIQLWRGRIYRDTPVLWILMLSFPLPYIATTFGWMTAEIGRQPWLIYGVMRTAYGISPMVSAANGVFTLLGFMGMYALLSMPFLFLIGREVALGPARLELERPSHSHYR